MKNDNCCPCSIVSVPGVRTLSFPDGSEAGVVGLDRIFAEMRRAGRQPNSETASEIVDRLAQENYVAFVARPMYEEAVLKEYRAFLETAAPEGEVVFRGSVGAVERKKGLFHNLFALLRRRNG